MSVSECSIGKGVLVHTFPSDSLSVSGGCVCPAETTLRAASEAQKIQRGLGLQGGGR